MDKVKLTQEQAAFVEEWKSIKNGFENFVRALNEDYEIEEEKPDFKTGHKVISQIDGDKILTLSNPMVGKPAWFFMKETVSWDYEENFRHATPEEIYWLETLGREKVGDFREGDIFVDESGCLYTIGIEIDSEVAAEWASNRVLKAIYPVESFKPFLEEEAE